MKKHLLRLTIGAIAAIMSLSACAGGETPAEPAFIPEPESVEFRKGHFTARDGITVAYDDESLAPAAEYLNGWLSKNFESRVSADGKGDIILSLSGSDQKEGSYELNATRRKVTIRSASYGGIISGISSFRQLFPAESEAGVFRGTEVAIPAVHIEDAPRFGWRGVHLDVARHFFDKEEVMRLLDCMALYKLNKFHWHLTDDQGWRIEIKAYPLLTEKGAWREYNNHDRGIMRIYERTGDPAMKIPEKHLRTVDGKTLYGGFYTQDEIREVVAYAAKLGIDVMPEIDVPGHSSQAILNYPWLSCFNESTWGKVFSAPLCPGKDTTLEFYRNVYAEIFELFPYEYVMLGADEVDMTNWSKCPSCQKRMKDHNITSLENLQAWFVSEMNVFFREHGRTLVGWDEIADGDHTPEGAAMLWWRNWAPKNLRKATGEGVETVMCPNVYCYLDYAEAPGDLLKVYNWEIFPDDFTEEQKACILGPQGNLWAEWVCTWERVGYQYFPRLWAISEVAWGRNHSDSDNFRERVYRNFPRLDALGFNYRLPAIEGFYNRNVFTDSTRVYVDYPLDYIELRYTTDGSAPVIDSELYTPEGILLTETTDLAFRTFKPDGKPGDITRTSYIKEMYAESAAAPAGLGEGLEVKWYKHRVDKAANVTKAPVHEKFVTDGIYIPQGVRGDIALEFTGYIDIPEDGIYTFYLDSDDGSILYIGDDLVVDNDGAHSPQIRTGQKALKKGPHAVRAYYFDYNGGSLDMGLIDSDGTYVSLKDKKMFRH